MTQEVSQTEIGEVFLASFHLIADTSESTRAKTAETFLLDWTAWPYERRHRRV
jgi:hypothetical protein